MHVDLLGFAGLGFVMLSIISGMSRIAMLIRYELIWKCLVCYMSEGR